MLKMKLTRYTPAITNSGYQTEQDVVNLAEISVSDANGQQLLDVLKILLAENS